MISISVVSYNGAAVTPSLSAHFDETGGSIGRADTNPLVLPDPERTISRIHAQVVFRGGAYAIIDRGSNAILVNGRPVGNGQEAPLKPGDEVQIGGYLLRVAAGAPASSRGASVDPFADFGGLAAPSPPPGMTPTGGGFPDPLGGLGRRASAPAVTPTAAPAAGLPEDWNPFAPGGAPAAAPRADPFGASFGAPAGGRADFGLEVAGRGPAPLIPDFGGPGSGAPGGDSIDRLFGLGSGSAGGSADPFANSALGQAAAMPNMSAHADPMQSLRSVTRASASAAPDHLSELQAPFNLAPMSAPPAASASPTAAAPAVVAPKGAVMSWDEPSGESRTLIRAKAAPAPAAAAMPAASPVFASPAYAPTPAAPMAAAPIAGTPIAAPGSAAAPPSLALPDFAPPTPIAAPAPTVATAPPAPAAAVDLAALTAALRAGLATDGLPPTPLTPELMLLLGQLLHEATRGTVDLLVARAALKREVRAEVTMIVARENNPLKFSPSVDVALGHLLGPTARGFMPPALAMRDAYDDLRAHQFGFLAGMRAALEGVLLRFQPAALEAKLTQKSVLDSLLPSGRKARMWDLFNELYTQISSEAADDFHELFGKAFLKAYQAHIDELARDRGT
ncbi:MAG: type VI secretion system-associated FHA domain protein TagH [Burkholderiaceae bacterium]